MRWRAPTASAWLRVGIALVVRRPVFSCPANVRPRGCSGCRVHGALIAAEATWSSLQGCRRRTRSERSRLGALRLHAHVERRAKETAMSLPRSSAATLVGRGTGSTVVRPRDDLASQIVSELLHYSSSGPRGRGCRALSCGREAEGDPRLTAQPSEDERCETTARCARVPNPSLQPGGCTTRLGRGSR